MENISPEILRKQEIVNLSKELEESEDVELIKLNLVKLFNLIENDLGIYFTDDTEELYGRMRKENCLARVDRLSNILKVLELGESVHIGDENEHYANAVTPELEGLKIAYGEAQAPGPVKMMVGFGKTVIGFKTDHMKVDMVQYDENDLRQLGQRSIVCRHVSGDLMKDDIKVVVMRIPVSMCDVSILKEGELDGRQFVFRGFTL